MGCVPIYFIIINYFYILYTASIFKILLFYKTFKKYIIWLLI